METIYYLFFLMIGIVIAIGVGIELSNAIDEFIIYVLFWMLYIITIITFINIVLVGNYYLNMKNKTGPVGPQGPSGDRGDKGETGLCDVGCRDSICENDLNDMVLNLLKDKNKGVIVKMNNIYIKSKIRQMCTSNEFRQLTPYNGQINLINYLKNIWNIWVDLIYASGGLKYFENIGAESDFEWLTTNPFDELKQYDVFYWGMGKQYRPQVIDKCYTSSNGNTPDDNSSSYILRMSTSNYYEFLGNDKDTGAIDNVSFWRANQFTYKGNVYYPVGDIALGPSRYNEYYETARKVDTYIIPGYQRGPIRETIIVSGDVRGPIDYELIWTNNGFRGTIFWIWRPIPPPDFIALGDIVTFSINKPGTNDNAPIRCVPKDITVRTQYNGNVLWTSVGSRTQTTVSLLGYVPNENNKPPDDLYARPDNAYNLFRAVIGSTGISPSSNISKIPETDVNGNFYRLNPEKYDSTFKIGLENGYNPDISLNANRVGKGYLPSSKKDTKYSVMAYLKLKNNAVLVHQLSKIILKCSLIPNAISNAYLLKKNNKCLNYIDDTTITLSESLCDELIDTQIFSIIFTGDKKNECRIQHYTTQKYIKYKSNLFVLIGSDDTSDREYTLFFMT